MTHPELYSWSHQYRQERLSEASRLHLEAKLRASRKERERPYPISTFRNLLALLRSSTKSSDLAAGESFE